jgi:hypothetical protein
MLGLNSTRSMVVVLVAATALGIAGTSITRWYRAANRPATFPAFGETGRTLARETVRLLNGSGQIVVWELELQSAANPMLQASAAAFTKAVRQTRGMVVTATVRESYNPWDPDGWKQTALEPTRFTALVEKYRQADAIVLIGATPRLTEEDGRRLPTPRPKIIAADLLGTPAQGLWNQQVVQLAIVPRTGGTPNSGLPQTPAAWFERMYTIVTPDNAGSLP